MTLKGCVSWVWWRVPVIPALGRLRLENHEFKAILGDMARPYIQKKKPTKTPPPTPAKKLIPVNKMCSSSKY
jgi:hypothetical protein